MVEGNAFDCCGVKPCEHVAGVAALFGGVVGRERAISGIDQEDRE